MLRDAYHDVNELAEEREADCWRSELVKERRGEIESNEKQEA